MASDKIFVDLDEEIIFTVERIVESSANRVIVVIPESANLVASLLSLKLLAREVLKTNKNIVIVTEDKLGLKLADKAGLIAKGKISEITPKVWVEAEELKKNFIEAKDKLKKDLLSERSEVSDYKIVDEDEIKKDKSKQEETKDTNNPTGAKNLVPATSTLPVIPDKPRLDPKVVNLGVIKVLAGGDVEQTPKYVSELMAKKKVDVEQDQAHSLAKDQGVEKEEQVKVESKKDGVQGEVTAGKRDLGKEETEADTQEEGSFTDKVAEKKVDKVIKEQGIFQSAQNGIIGRDWSNYFSQSQSPKRRKGKSKFAGDMKNVGAWSMGGANDTNSAGASGMGHGAAFVPSGSPLKDFFGRVQAAYFSVDKRIRIAIGVLLGFILFFILSTKVLASADVTIKLSSENVNVNENVTGSLNLVQADYTTKTIPIRQIKVNDTSSNSADTTGKAKEGVTAKGVVTIYNKAIPNKVTLASGTVLQRVDSTGLTYKLTSSVEVPAKAGDGSIGTLDNVSVEAVTYGENYNVTSSVDFKVAGYTTDQVSARAMTGITGGTTSDEKAVAQTDIDALKTSITNDLKSTLKDELDQLVSDDEMLLVDTIKYGTANVTSDKKVDEKADSVAVTVGLDATGYVVSKKDLRHFVAQAIQNSSGFEGQVNENKLADPTIQNVVVETDKVTFTIVASGDVTGGITASEVKKNIAGKSIGEANTYLKKLEGVDSYKLSVGPFYLPSFLKKVPGDQGKITVIIKTGN